MLAIRMQRTGRKGHAQFRVIVQDNHFHPTRGRVVAYLGSYNPHSKSTQIDKELAEKYLGNGAQPSDRVARLLKSEGVKLPDWVKLSDPKERTIRNPEKLRRNQPKEEAPVAEETPEISEPVEVPTAEAPAETEQGADPAEETPAEQTTSAEAETPADDTPAEVEQAAPAETEATEAPSESA